MNAFSKLALVCVTVVGFQSFADDLNVQNLIQTSIQTRLRVQQLDHSIEGMKDQIRSMSKERDKLDDGIKLSSQQFLSILSQHPEAIGGCSVQVQQVQNVVNLTVKRADGLAMSAAFDLRKLKDGKYKADGRVSSSSRIMLLQAKDMIDQTGQETKMTLSLNENNTLRSLHVSIELKGKNFDTKDCR